MLTDEQCMEFRRMPGSFNDMVRAIHASGAQAERERCARVAEKTFKSTEARYGMTWYVYHKDIAAAIREG